VRFQVTFQVEDTQYLEELYEISVRDSNGSNDFIDVNSMNFWNGNQYGALNFFWEDF